MLILKKHLPRRTFLRGVGVALGLPMLDAMVPALSALAHSRGLWIRFYTLNGHAEADDRGWTVSYNFGSSAAVETRWRAARDAGVDFIASDQYEGLARVLAAPLVRSATPP